MSKFFHLVIVILFGINSSLIFPQTIEERIDFLNKVDKSLLEDSIGAITWSIFVQPPETAKKHSNLLLKKTKEIGIKANLIAKSFSLNYEKTNYIAKLDSIYNTAKENDLTGIMAGVLVTKSDYYKKNEKYDSAMVATLEAQNIYEDASGIDGFVTCRQIIGDLYFTA
ncbi:MAG: hypothetical protein KKF62_04390 [Bacteroidetes bacterium]|nr:hypothetical protein [Bacteroidota bacterium]MBU1115648.1 hypothetical protein [Bacteroidota bacterium]MBU1799966.1 hypothetical protein [Bacteroidota bacterium]